MLTEWSMEITVPVLKGLISTEGGNEPNNISKTHKLPISKS